MITILLADDHILVRQGLRLLLEQAGFQVIGEACDGLEAVQLVRQLQPQIAILDLSMPVLNGVSAATEIIKSTGGSTKVILLTMHSEQPYVMSAFAAGVHGYVLKKRAATNLIEAIHEVQRGHTFLSPEISRSVIDTSVTDLVPEEGALSDRELHVLQLVAEGMRTKAIADLLSISGKTVESHRTRIMQKLGIHDTAGLVLYAIRKGIIQA
jgi:two-component system, NarL family, response regulator NreC